MKNIGILGISANPPHVGHVLIAHYVSLMDKFDEVLVIPCFSHPAGKDLEDFYHRFKMCQLCMGHIPKVTVDPVESLLPGPSYSLQTIEYLIERRPANYRFIIGSDILFNTHLWKDDDLGKIFELAPPFILGRLGYDHPDVDSATLQSLNISSTKVRTLLNTPDSDRELSRICPASVLEYIREHNLYQFSKPDNNMTSGPILPYTSQFTVPSSSGDPFDSVIDEFRHEHEFLSNFHERKQISSITYYNKAMNQFITVDDTFPTLEHAFQASKTQDKDAQILIRDSATAKDAKRLGRMAKLIQDWDTKRLEVMKRLVTDKFNQHLDLKLKLLFTGNKTLIEGNTWKDSYWGVSNGVGENNLGKILMEVRSEIVNKDGTFQDVLDTFLQEHNLNFVSNKIKAYKVFSHLNKITDSDVSDAMNNV